MKLGLKKAFDVFRATLVVWVVTKILKVMAPAYFGVKQSISCWIALTCQQ
jgi:hypothetical protein